MADIVSLENVGMTSSPSVWDRSHIRAMLKEPVGAPITLAKEEALAIAREAFGRVPSLPSGEEYVHRVRNLWGSLIERSNG